MAEHAEIAQMMQSYAQQAVELARSLKVGLDFSEPSLQQLELLLARLAESDAQSKVGKSADELARLGGAYFGEVVRRRFGGHWTVEKYPQGDFLIVTLNVNGARLFPVMKAHRRLTQGAAENLWNFYQTVREKLSAQPVAKIH